MPYCNSSIKILNYQLVLGDVKVTEARLSNFLKSEIRSFSTSGVLVSNKKTALLDSGLTLKRIKEIDVALK